MRWSFSLILGLLLSQSTSTHAFIKGNGANSSASALSPPSAASAYGFNTLTFDSEFDDISEIDVNNTLKPGYKWYVQSLVLFTYPKNTLIAFAPSSFSVSNSILHYSPNTPAGDPDSGGNIYSAGYKADNTFVGNTIKPTGFYAEARMKYDPTCINATKFWFPAFWMWDESIMYNSGTNTAYGSNRYTEFDIFEATGNTVVGYTDWDWSQLGSSLVQVKNINDMLGVPNPIDNQFHIYAIRWVPMAKNGGTGYITRYVDNVYKSAGDVTYSSSTISAEAASGATTGWMSGTDASTMGFTVQLQAGENCPIDVDWVRIWQ
jgi:hypothetical protein